MPWKKADISKAQKILKRYHVAHFQEALNEVSEALGREVTGAALRGLFLRRKLGPPSSFCKQWEQSEPSLPSYSPMVGKLVEATKRGPVKFSDLCDKLNLSPAKTKELIQQSRQAGVSIHVEHDHVGIRNTYEEKVTSVGIAPVVGERQKIAVISDTHLGSKYCLREQLVDFIEHAYEQGVRDILHPGDVLDGMYRHGLWEVSHSGLEAQTEDLFEVLPKKKGLNYHCITGNHDWTFAEASGVDAGSYMSTYFKERGRNDLHFYGNRGAFLRVKGALIHLWHPRSGNSYAKSYGIQKHIEKYSAIKPQILLAGHWHTFCYVYERGIHGIACPTFQGGGSAFSKSLGGAPSIGGLLLSWDLTEHGTIRSFVIEKRAYFEEEQPLEPRNQIDAVPVR